MAYYRDPTSKPDQAPDRFLEVFGEFDFVCFDESCSFFCPDCRNMLTCAVYRDFREDWEPFYS